MMFIPEGIALRGQRRKLGTGAHTVRDKSRLEMAELRGFRKVAASPSKMAGDRNLTETSLFRAFSVSRRDVSRLWCRCGQLSGGQGQESLFAPRVGSFRTTSKSQPKR